jgi:6-phospho-beta-glucosidase
VEPERIELEQVGLNHLTWIRAVRVDGVDRLDELLGDGVRELADDVHVTADRLIGERAIPSYYLRYYDDEAGVIAAAKTTMTRAEEVMTIERDLLELYRDPALDTKPELLEHRGGAFYSEAAAQLIASLTDGRGDLQVVDVRNDGTLPGLADADVVEVPARIDRDGAHPIPQVALPAAQAALVARVKQYERLAVRAARTGDRAIALEALAANPLAGGAAQAEEVLDAILEANRQWLPQFAAAG